MRCYAFLAYSTNAGLDKILSSIKTTLKCNLPGSNGVKLIKEEYTRPGTLSSEIKDNRRFTHSLNFAFLLLILNLKIKKIL